MADIRRKGSRAMEPIKVLALGLGNFAQGKVLVVTHIEVFPLFFGQHTAVGIKQQYHFHCVHAEPPLLSRVSP